MFIMYIRTIMETVMFKEYKNKSITNDFAKYLDI